tara:strand:- start:2104 stop:2604 length:501 start_codon:yes stop_codon:yes gene_type:complete
VGCAGGQRPSPSPSQAAAEASLPNQQPTPAATTAPEATMASDWVPPLFISPEEEASYYVSRLADRRFVTSYGDRDNRRPWYIAAEKLGEIGLPAVPLLFSRLDTNDAYEQMLVLYALQLATQDPQLMIRTRGEYVQLGVVLDPAYNAENAATAQQWWQQHAEQVTR